MTLLVALYLVGCVVAGIGVTYLSGADLGPEERIGYGVVLGAMAVTIAVFVLGVTVGFGGSTVLVALLGAAALGGLGFVVGRETIGHDLAELGARLRMHWRTPRSLVPLVALLAVVWPFLSWILFVTMRDCRRDPGT